MDRTWDIAVLGGGPVGVFTANLLAAAGHDVCVIERDTAPYGLPRAVHLDHEIVRLMRDVGVLDRLMALMRAGDGHIHTGADNGVIRFLSAAGQPRPFGHANDYFFYQPELEQILRDRLAEQAGGALMLGATAVSLEQDDEIVTVFLEDGAQVRARYVIGCDGARSATRKAMGIRLEDLDFEEPWLVVDAEVDGPIAFPDYWGVPEGANLQNLSLMQCDPARPATIVPGRGNHRRWEFMLLPGESDAEMAQPERVAAMVRPWIGDAPHKIIRAATYRFHGLVAEHWRKGRVFLAGDAAHQTPPFFGQGLCHGLRDGANLSWKLDLVLRGAADPDLLDTYQPERDAQVRHVIGRAIEAGRYICELDPGKAAERDARIRSEKGIRTASELIAPIASDIIAGAVGERFINPPMGQGRMLDDLTGGGWRLFLAVGATAPRLTALDGLGIRTIRSEDLPDPEGHMAHWFTERGAAAVLVRPDHYVAARAETAGALDAAVGASALPGLLTQTATA